MRTTLSLDDDVAALLTRLRKRTGRPLKTLVNEALRRGLAPPGDAPGPRKPYRTKGADLGACLLGSLDDVAEVLAVAEGESFR